MALNTHFALISLVILVCYWIRVDSATTNTQDYAKQEANWAVAELRKLSDSGVYESIRLHGMLSYSFEDASYHESTSLKVSLASPYFKSGEKSEAFEMVVLTHKEDGVKSLAIDNFPVMTDDSIEQHLVEKAKRKKQEREESFRFLEIERLTGNQQQGKSIKSLLEELDSPKAVKEREASSFDFLKYLAEPYVSEEKALSRLSLAALYDISLGGREHSDFQIERARVVLDNALLVKHV